MARRDARVRAEREAKDAVPTDYGSDAYRAYKEKHVAEREANDAKAERYSTELKAQYDALLKAEEPGFLARREFLQTKLGINDEASGEYDHVFYVELCVDANLFETWKKIFVERDRAFLRERSGRKLETLQTLYRQEMQGAAKVGDMSEAAHLARRKEAFKGFLLHPVHGSLHPERLSVILANSQLPADTKKRTARGDDYIGGDTFIYGSFGEFPHPFTGGIYREDYFARDAVDPLPMTTEEATKKSPRELSMQKHQYLLDERGFLDTADVAMFDIHLAKIGPKSGKNGYLGAYLDNYFDYQTGKQIMETYLRLVFESPEEARAYAAGGGGEFVLEQFYKEFPELGAKDRIGRTRTEEIHRKMREIFLATGIAPPLMHELRIPDHATVVSEMPDSKKAAA
jgi:hypothetical protein